MAKNAAASPALPSPPSLVGKMRFCKTQYMSTCGKLSRLSVPLLLSCVCVWLAAQVTVGADDLTANYRVEQHVEVVEERERDGKLLKLLATCHKTRCRLETAVCMQRVMVCLFGLCSHPLSYPRRVL